jgi:hypothetical protein
MREYGYRRVPRNAVEGVGSAFEARVAELKRCLAEEREKREKLENQVASLVGWQEQAKYDMEELRLKVDDVEENTRAAKAVGEGLEEQLKELERLLATQAQFVTEEVYAALQLELDDVTSKAAGQFADLEESVRCLSQNHDVSKETLERFQSEMHAERLQEQPQVVTLTEFKELERLLGTRVEFVTQALFVTQAQVKELVGLSSCFYKRAEEEEGMSENSACSRRRANKYDAEKEVADSYKEEEDINEGEERRGDGREREKWREMPSEGVQLQSDVVIVGGAVGGGAVGGGMCQTAPHVRLTPTPRSRLHTLRIRSPCRLSPANSRRARQLARF